LFCFSSLLIRTERCDEWLAALGVVHIVGCAPQTSTTTRPSELSMSELGHRLNVSLGFAFDAVALLAMLYGITLGQVAYYFKTYRGDSWKVQLMVALLL